MARIVLHEGDARGHLARLATEDRLFNSCVTDPPYFLESVVRRFGAADAKPARPGPDGRFARASRGFIGQRWDGADDSAVKVAFDPAFWRALLLVLKPGAFVFAFAGARTGHRQACAMEDAGFVMHPMHGWC